MSENGRIINFSTSVTGQMFPAYISYATTKGAVVSWSRSLDLKALRAPGPVKTELFTAGKTPEQVKSVGSMNDFGRLGEPEDNSNDVLFLASPESYGSPGRRFGSTAALFNKFYSFRLT